jgi:superfamily II DNA/RNA helicase
MVRPGETRAKIIGDLIQVRNSNRAIIFCNTKNEASKVALYLSGRGISCDALHSDLSQFQREQAMAAFRKGTTKAITATDVAARGIDVPDCDLVIHSEPPGNGFEYYIHRSGRTGRAGKEGTSIVLHGRKHRDFIFELDKIGVELKNIKPPTQEEVITLAIKAEAEKMKTIPKALVDKVLPEAERMFQEQGVVALAKALILSTKSQPR